MIRPVKAILALYLLSACTIDPNIPGQTTVQSIEGRSLTVGYADAVFDPAPIATADNGDISPFPLVGANGIRVQDEGARPLNEDDQGIAQGAAAAHCRDFGQNLAPGEGLFYPAEASWVFGRCVE